MTNMISNIQRSNTNYKIDSQKEPKADKSEISKAGPIQKQDTVVIGGGAETAVTYSKAGYKLSAEDVKAIKGQEQKNLNSLRNLVRELILKQNKDFKESEEMTDLTDILLTDEAGPTAGQAAATAETEQVSALEGYYSVEAVSDRIVDFAISISGGDKSKLEELIAAIDKGFGQAREAFGRELPEICDQTYTAIMQKLDDWKNEA